MKISFEGEDTDEIVAAMQQFMRAHQKPRKPATPSETKKAAATMTWESYACAYRSRYGAPPVRNAKVNSQIKQFVERVGEMDAPLVANYYVTHNNRWYIERGHAVGNMLQDSEKLRTEWATSRQITSSEARAKDKTAGNVSWYKSVTKQ